MSDETAKNEKYVVFKREDWDIMWSSARQEMARRGDDVGAIDIMRTIIETQEVPDAVVMRRQDYIAGPALAVYAHGVALALRVAGMLETGELNERGIRLRNIGDYFHEQSEAAYAEGHKLPD